jgi:hypothetical protein
VNNTVQFKIADIVVAVTGNGSCPPLGLHPSYRRFQTAGAGPHISLQVQVGDIPPLPYGEKLFESGGSWSLYRHQDRYLVPQIFSGKNGATRLAVMNSDFSGGDLYLRPEELGPPYFDPIEYPLDEVIMINFLGRGRLGLNLHALGLEDDGRGLLFSGVSGAGKSTMAQLWQDSGAILLSDDRIIVRPENRRFWIYGTPWMGDARISDPKRAPLTRLYFLEKANHNYATPLSRAEAAVRLLVRCFPPFYDPGSMEYTLELVDRIAAGVPCYELGFVPAAGVVDFVRRLL